MQSNYEEATVEEIMTFWVRGKTLQETADHFGKSYRVIEQMVSRYGHRYERSFNFPHIMRARRFGAK